MVFHFVLNFKQYLAGRRNTANLVLEVLDSELSEFRTLNVPYIDRK